MINKPLFSRWRRPKNWFSNIKDIYFWVKYLKQRAFRGYADCDTWSLDYYLSEVIIGALKKLQKDPMGHPCDFNNVEEWKLELQKMIEGFEAAKRIINLDYADHIQPNWFKNEEPFTDETLKKVWEEQQKDQKTFEEMMPIFTKYFFNLWD